MATAQLQLLASVVYNAGSPSISNCLNTDADCDNIACRPRACCCSSLLQLDKTLGSCQSAFASRQVLTGTILHAGQWLQSCCSSLLQLDKTLGSCQISSCLNTDANCDTTACRPMASVLCSSLPQLYTMLGPCQSAVASTQMLTLTALHTGPWLQFCCKSLLQLDKMLGSCQISSCLKTDADCDSLACRCSTDGVSSCPRHPEFGP